MNVEQQREELKKVYPNSDRWLSRVEKMPAAQVIAIFNKFKADGKLGR